MKAFTPSECLTLDEWMGCQSFPSLFMFSTDLLEMETAFHLHLVFLIDTMKSGKPSESCDLGFKRGLIFVGAAFI